MEQLTELSWPGNIRELQNFIERRDLVQPDRHTCAARTLKSRLEIESGRDPLKQWSPVHF